MSGEINEAHSFRSQRQARDGRRRARGMKAMSFHVSTLQPRSSLSDRRAFWQAKGNVRWRKATICVFLSLGYNVEVKIHGTPSILQFQIAHLPQDTACRVSE
jgi:hypothetical protein